MKQNLNLGKNTALILTGNSDRLYFSGIAVDEGLVVVTDSSTYLFTDARYFIAIEQVAQDLGVTPILYKGFNCLKEFFKQNRIKKGYVNYSTTTLLESVNLKKQGVKILDGTSIISKCRVVKSDEEIAFIQKACEITQTALLKAVKKIKLGITEKQVATLIEKEMVKLGAQGLAFDTIVAFGKNSAIPHHVTGDTPLTENTVVLIDTGAKYKGYCADITRTYFFGKPNGKFIDRYNAVLDANLLAEEKIYVGLSVKDADNIARQSLKQVGLDNFFTHSLGHGLGLDIHESPSLSPKGEGTILENSPFTIEPGVYFDGEYGIRIEDTVYISGEKLIRLFTDDKTLTCLN